MSAPSPMCRTAILIVALAAGFAAFVPGSIYADASGAVSAAPIHPAKSHRKVADGHPLHEAARTRPAVHSRQTATTEHRAKAERSGRRPAERAAAHIGAHSRVAEQHASAVQTRRAGRERTGHTTMLETERERIAREAAASRRARETARVEQQKSREARDDGTAHGASAAVAASLAVAAPIIGAADAPDVTPNAFTPPSRSLSIAHRGMPPPLRGSLASLERQDERLEADGLERIEDEDDLSARIEHHLLVPIPVSDALTVDEELPAHHRYCRPWTARFLADLARAHEAAFHRPFEVSSAVRTVAYQAQLMRINGNAAPAEGDLFSPHLMGATVDIAKKDMSRDEIAWMRRHLLALQLAGKIDVEEEFEQACFHISVYRSYMPVHTVQPPRNKGRRQAGVKAASEHVAAGQGY